ncbi:MAG: histidine phosphatase family protein [Anaerolineales bacterium]|nr:histidine phosphatase family protein [Anaerolineales bacterium]
MRTTIAFVCHGEVHNPQGLVYGRLPGFELSAEGRRQAAAARRFLADNLGIDRVFSSLMPRAQQTAAIIAQEKLVQESLILIANEESSARWTSYLSAIP